MKIISWLQLAAVILVAVILFYGVYRGISKGSLAAKSEVVLANARALTVGLDYFYQDQNRYPSQAEFANTNLMLAYITGYPPVTISDGACAGSRLSSGNYDYHSLDFRGYQLNFCLPASVEKFPAGLNAANR
jgi:hypothetical protein